LAESVGVPGLDSQAMSESRSVGIALKGVSKRFDRVGAVDGVTLSIAEGEFFSLLGPSGSFLLLVDHRLVPFVESAVREEYIPMRCFESSGTWLRAVMRR
jgi:ABC-type antimicrobial peptide transport system ATPase subunit